MKWLYWKHRNVKSRIQDATNSSGFIGPIGHEKLVILIVVLIEAKNSIAARRTLPQSLDKSHTRVENASNGDQETENNNGNVERTLIPLHGLALEAQVKITRPDEREHGASDAADEAHQNGEVRYEDGEKEREENEPDARDDRPHFQVSVRVVACELRE